MIQCKECGTQTAETDLYCPICGISLQEVPVAGKSVEDPFASTIVIPSKTKEDVPTVSEGPVATEPPSNVHTFAPSTTSSEKVSTKGPEDSSPVTDMEASTSDAAKTNADPKASPSEIESPLKLDEEAVVATGIATGIAEHLSEESFSTPIGEPSVRLPQVLDSKLGLDERAPKPLLHEELNPDDAVVEGVGHTETEASERRTIAYGHSQELIDQLAKDREAEDELVIDPSNGRLSESKNEEPEEIASDPTVVDISTPDEAVSAAETPDPMPSPGELISPAGSLAVDSASEASSSSLSSTVPGIAGEPEPSALASEALVAVDEEVSPSPAVVSTEVEEPQPAGEHLNASENEDELEAPIEVAEVKPPSESAPKTASGDIGKGGESSFTTPNIGRGGTDGRRSGLKPLTEGTVLNNRYQIVKKIGGGGMGAVYLANDQNLGGTQRAVKEMVQSHIEEEQQAKAIEDFKRESMILSSLDHPSIPTIYDYFYDGDESRFYLVMKYIAGGDLASRLRAAPEGRIDERSVTEWAIQIIDVLDYLHSLPTTIVYRDLKPSNVMIDSKSGRVMLIDFGIARSINQNQEKGVTAVGTMGYAPPELFSGQVEPRSDIYSLGSTMFHLLTGADPQNNPLLIFDFQKNPRPRQINPRLSDQMETILMRAVEYNAEARFASAAEMKRALEKHLADLQTGNVTYGISEIPAAVSLANQIVFCGFCGQRIVATDLFCAFCGSKQPIAQHGVHSEIYARGSLMTARLVIDGTSELETPAFSLDKNENLVGRRDPMSNIFPEVDLSKYDPQTKISRRHARIWREGSSFLVEDLGSSNGTMLLSKASDTFRLTPHKPQPLTNGDRIRLGDTTLQFILG